MTERPPRLGIAHVVFLTVLAVYPYVFLFNLFFPSTLSVGKNTYVAVQTLLLSGVLAALAPRIARPLLLFAPVALAAVSVICLRALVYGEPPITLFLAFRAPFTLLIYCGAACGALLDPRARTVARKILIVNCVLQAAIGLIHDTFFPHIVAGVYVEMLGIHDQLYYVGEPGKVRFREAGLLISPNVFSNFIVVGMIVLVFQRFRDTTARPFSLIDAALLVVMMWGLSLAGSRYPIAVAAAVFVAYMLRKVSLKAIAPIAVVGVLAFVLMAPFFASLQNRFRTEGSGGRAVKARLAAELLAKDAGTLLIGAPLIDQDRASERGLGISDNSIFAVALCFGIPVALLIAVGVGAMLATTLDLSRYRFVLAYGAVAFVLTNAIYWDIWLLYWFSALYAMQPIAQRSHAPERRFGWSPLKEAYHEP